MKVNQFKPNPRANEGLQYVVDSGASDYLALKIAAMLNTVSLNLEAEPARVLVVSDLRDAIAEHQLAVCRSILICCDLLRIDRSTITNQRWRQAFTSKHLLILNQENIELLRHTFGEQVDCSLFELPYQRITSLPSCETLTVDKIYLSIDSYQRTLDPAQLMPIPPIPQQRPLLENVERWLPQLHQLPPKKTIRNRLGATKRHLKKCVKELLAQWMTGGERSPQPRVPIPNPDPGTCRLGVEQSYQIDLRGITYTCVIEQLDAESNWVDLLGAFCTAFKRNNRAVLVVYLRGDRRESCAADFHHVLCTLGPLACRVYLLQGELSETEFCRLVAETQFYVSPSKRLDLQLDLIEFASVGTPVISLPNCLDTRVCNKLITYPILYSKELSYPDKSTEFKYTTHALRMNWDSLYDLFKQSFQQALNEECYKKIRSRQKNNFEMLSTPNSIVTEISLRQLTSLH